MATPFEYLEHFVAVPFTLNGVERRFVLDSGIGLTLVSDGAGLEPLGRSFTGRRMSGQEVTVPLARAGSLAFDELRREDVEVGVLDLGGVDGILSLAFFDDVPLTVDYPRQEVRLGPPKPGVEVGVSVEREGPSVTVFMPLELPGGSVASVEVDMGSDVLILDERFAAEVGVDLAGPDVRRVEGEDETGHRYVRSFAQASGRIQPPGVPALAQEGPQVMFQAIVHDGLVGREFLQRFAVTFDVAGARLVFGGAG